MHTKPVPIAAIVTLLLVLFLGLSACAVLPTQLANSVVMVKVIADNVTATVEVPRGSSVQEVLIKANISTGPLDRIEPALETILNEPQELIITRVDENFIEVTETIPFEHQTIKNETMPTGEQRILQQGVNGEQKVTYKQVLENGAIVSKSVFDTTIVTPALPEILMVGVLTPITPQPISGTIAYIEAGNAWIMENSTANRKPVVTTGDLDGRILRISYDREWLLFTRKASTGTSDINSLWVVNLNKDGAAPIDLQVKNVIHYADWILNASQTIVYSTVEPRPASPGWQANNDLYYKQFFKDGTLGSAIKKLEVNSGGVFGSWGADFSWSRDGSRMLYTRPDGVGFINLKSNSFAPLVTITPYDTNSYWAWNPGISWSPDNNYLYMVRPGTMNQSGTTPQSFSLSAWSFEQEILLELAGNVGPFSYPVTSPLQADGSFEVAFLKIIFPDQPQTGSYHIFMMDQDGSNQVKLFPDEGMAGVQPQVLQWSPDHSTNPLIGFIYEGNIWLIDTITENKYQVTSDGLISQLHWR